MVLAFGSTILRAQYPLSDPARPVITLLESSEEPAAGYLRNATSTILDLQFGDASLLSVQAVVLMVCLPNSALRPDISSTLRYSCFKELPIP
jgi:hypothetical protein